VSDKTKPAGLATLPGLASIVCQWLAESFAADRRAVGSLAGRDPTEAKPGPFHVATFEATEWRTFERDTAGNIRRTRKRRVRVR
jgi:hypothetical protein